MLLLRQIDEGLGISRSLARYFYDARNPLFIEHSVRELVAQRLLGMAAGYEDLNDHNLLRLDPLFAVAVGKEDPLGSGRAPQDQGKALGRQLIFAFRRGGLPAFRSFLHGLFRQL
jgi:hypothetical protein